MIEVVILFSMIYFIEKMTSTFGIAHKIFWKLVDLTNSTIDALRKYSEK